MPLSAHSVVITGLIRDGERSLRDSVLKLAKVFASAKSLCWWVVESDSSDGTLAVLKGLEAEVPNFRWVSLGSLREEMPKRTVRVAHCRNHCLELIRDDPRCAEVDLVVVADLDALNAELTTAAVESCFASDKEWDAVFANQRGPYYDLWALRHPLWMPNDCVEQMHFMIQLGLPKYRALRLACKDRNVTIPAERDWIEVDSAFGGLGIFRKEAALAGAGRYAGLRADGKAVCEHVPFCRELREKGYKLWINPALINAGRTEHTRWWPSAWLYFRFWLSDVLKGRW